MIKKILSIFLIFFLPNIFYAKSDSFKKGIDLYNKDKLEEAKFRFEQEIVLYLSKIFNKQDKKNLEEQNLNTVMLLNPKNEEAIYYLVKLKLSNSDYKKSRELNQRLKSICNKFCTQSEKLKVEIENLSKK